MCDCLACLKTCCETARKSPDLERLGMRHAETWKTGLQISQQCVRLVKSGRKINAPKLGRIWGGVGSDKGPGPGGLLSSLLHLCRSEPTCKVDLQELEGKNPMSKELTTRVGQPSQAARDHTVSALHTFLERAMDISCHAFTVPLFYGERHLYYKRCSAAGFGDHQDSPATENRNTLNAGTSSGKSALPSLLIGPVTVTSVTRVPLARADRPYHKFHRCTSCLTG